MGALGTLAFSLFQKGDEDKAKDEMYHIWKNLEKDHLYEGWKLGYIDGIFFKSGLYDNSPMAEFVKTEIEGYTEFKRNFTMAMTDASTGNIKFRYPD